MSKFSLLALVASAFLVGCGGGGGGDDAPSPGASPAQGAWEGALSDGRAFNALVLGDGTFYTLYGSNLSGSFYVSGLIYGNGTYGANSVFRDLNAQDFVAPDYWVRTVLDGSYEPGERISGAVLAGQTRVSFSGLPIAKANYDYNTPANVASLAGNWAMNATTGDFVSVSIAGNSISATSSGCGFSGTVYPRSSGKNVYDVALTFGGSPCRFAGEKMNGNALLTKMANGQQQLVVVSVSQDRSVAVAAFGVK